MTSCARPFLGIHVPCFFAPNPSFFLRFHALFLLGQVSSTKEKGEIEREEGSFEFIAMSKPRRETVIE